MVLDLDFGFWILDYGLWIMDYGLWIMDYGLWIMDYGLWIWTAFSSGDRAQDCNKCYVVSARINQSQSEGPRVVTQL
ncbi:hypothetical protein C8F01DRAFT_1155588 [Mycena amicta]|nr:hypothetical protein C8F01DRAFT_1155588 [Mycena amicta]